MWFRNMQQDMNTLRENNVKLEESAKTSQETIKQMQEEAAQLAKANAELQKNLQESEKYKDELSAKLKKHDLYKLSIQKPDAIQLRINNATAKVFRDFESLTAQ